MAELAFIEMGSNIEPEVYLPAAVERLKALGILRKVSSAYRNPAVGPAGQPDFVNSGALLETDLEPPALRDRLKAIEKDLGRQRGPDKYAPRTIDLDLCLFGEMVVEAPDSQLPSPDLLTRGYLAAIMAELAPDFVHPLTREPLSEIAARLEAGADLTLDGPLTRRLKGLQG